MRPEFEIEISFLCSVHFTNQSIHCWKEIICTSKRFHFEFRPETLSVDCRWKERGNWSICKWWIDNYIQHQSLLRTFQWIFYANEFSVEREKPAVRILWICFALENFYWLLNRAQLHLNPKGIFSHQIISTNNRRRFNTFLTFRNDFI